MRNRNGTDILKIFDSFQKTINKKPSYKTMMEEVRMMNLKVRPMQGDILSFDLQNKQLIELLWSLGKLEELFQNKYRTLSRKDKGVFIRIFDSMYQKFQSELGKINLRKDRPSGSSPAIEMEIFKEQKQKKLN